MRNRGISLLGRSIVLAAASLSVSNPAAAANLTSRLAGRDVCYPHGRQHFGADGTYNFGGGFFGTWTANAVTADAVSYTVRFADGHYRHDTISIFPDGRVHDVDQADGVGYDGRICN